MLKNEKPNEEDLGLDSWAAAAAGACDGADAADAEPDGGEADGDRDGVDFDDLRVELRSARCLCRAAAANPDMDPMGPRAPPSAAFAAPARQSDEAASSSLFVSSSLSSDASLSCSASGATPSSATCSRNHSSTAADT
jgi:hypothetical protein